MQTAAVRTRLSRWPMRGVTLFQLITPAKLRATNAGGSTDRLPKNTNTTIELNLINTTQLRRHNHFERAK